MASAATLRDRLRRHRHQGGAGRPRDRRVRRRAGADPHAGEVHPARTIAEIFVDLLAKFPDCTGAVGVTVPGVVRHGVVHSAANIDKAWIGTDADALFTEATGREVHVVNDADAAGLAEVRYGAARGRSGLVIVTTLGTGIGSALVHDGVLVPNAELGHLEIDGHDAESRAANSARDARGPVLGALGRSGSRRYYRTLEMLFSPELFVVGGGVSKDVRRVPAAARHRHRDRPGDSCATRPASSAPRSTPPRAAAERSRCSNAAITPRR